MGRSPVARGAARARLRGPALLAAGVLMLFAVPVSAASKGRKAPVPPRDTTAVLARIGGTKITEATVQKRLEELPEQYRSSFSTPEGRRQLLDRILEEQVWANRAEQSGVAERPDVKAQLDRQRRDFIVRTYVNEQMASRPAVADSEARAYYDAHISEYRTPATVTLEHILVADEKQARKVRQLAERGDDWGALVTRYSTDSLTVPAQGSLGTVTREGRFGSIGAQPALAESALVLGSGAIGGPFQTDRGWHVIRVANAQLDGVRSFEQVKSLIVRQLSTERSQDYYQKLLGEARTDLGVTVDSAAVDRWITRRLGAREMFLEAQSVAPAHERIAAYEKVVATYPDSAISAQAQFMAGFIRSEELKDYDGAEKAFQRLLELFPKSELVESAQWMLANMRTTDAPIFPEAAGDTLAPRGATKGAKSP